jgi:hypothetical protein
VKDNQAFVICIQTELGECYLGQRDSVMSKIRGAVFYHDDMHAKFELDKVVNEFKNTNNTFFNDETKLSIKMVEINIS